MIRSELGSSQRGWCLRLGSVEGLGRTGQHRFKSLAVLSNHQQVVYTVAGARNHLQATQRSIAFSFEIQAWNPHLSPSHRRAYDPPGGHSEGWNVRLTFNVEGIARAGCLPVPCRRQGFRGFSGSIG